MLSPLAWPSWARVGVAIGLLLIGYAIWLHFHDRRVIENHERGVNEQVQTKSSEAASAASTAAAQSKSKVEIENEMARVAASDSADPLADALRSLPRKGADKPAAR